MITSIRSSKRVWCPIRNYPIISYPEERVRQILLKEILAFDVALRNFILLEVKTKSGRADIVIHDETNIPLLTIELKAATEVLNEFTLNQVMNYWQTIQSTYVAISNGRQTIIYHVLDGVPKRIAETDIIQFLGKQEIEYPVYTSINRLSFEISTYFRYVNFLVEAGYISENSIPAKQTFYAELQNTILTEKYLPTNRELPIEIEGDFGTSYVAFKNAANGTWDGIHRNFRVNVKHKGTYTFRITILASLSTKEDKIFGNRVGGTYLNIVMQKESSSTYNLQMNLDKYTIEFENSYKIWHGGVKSRTKKDDVIKEVQDYAPFLLKNGRIELAVLPSKESITSEVFSHFIENLIVYSATRDRVK